MIFLLSQEKLNKKETFMDEKENKKELIIMNIYDFRIEIKANKVPININNEIIEYTQDENRQNHLYCEIYYKDIVISKGIVLDFYKEFKILEDFEGNLFTDIMTFEYNNRVHQTFTKLGKYTYEMKYLNKPPIQKDKRELYINEIISNFNGYINKLTENHNNLNITFIPSNSKIPDELANKLSVINTLPLNKIISKNNSISSKSITHLSEQPLNKYSVNLNSSNQDDIFILIDDVMGTGASLCEIMYKFYSVNKKTNYFFIPVKDVKR